MAETEKKLLYLGMGLLFGILVTISFFYFSYKPDNFVPMVLSKEIYLDNSNHFESIDYTSIECSKGVKLEKHIGSFYASTWSSDIGKAINGTCLIKYIGLVKK